MCMYRREVQLINKNVIEIVNQSKKRIENGNKQTLMISGQFSGTKKLGIINSRSFKKNIYQ